MPIDPSILQGIKPVQLDNPLDQFQKFSTAQNALSQNTIAQQDIAKTNALNRILADPNSLNADKSFNLPYIQANIGQGGGSALPGLAKTIAEMQAQVASTNKTKQEGVGLLLAQARDKRGALASQAVSDPAGALQGALDMVNSEYSGQYGQMLRQMGGTPEADTKELQDAAANHTLTSMLVTHSLTAEQAAKNDVSKLESIGGKTIQTTSKAYGEPNTHITFAVDNSVSPDARLGSQTSLANNAATNATSRANTQDIVAGAGQRVAQEQAGKNLDPLHAGSLAATATIAQNNEMIRLANSGANMGAGSVIFTRLQAIAAAAHLPGAENVKTTQELTKLLSGHVLSSVKDSGLGRVSNLGLTYLGASNPSADMTKAAIIDILQRSTLSAHYVRSLYNITAQGTYGISPMMQRAYPQMAPIRDDVTLNDLALDAGTLRPGTVVDGHVYKGGPANAKSSWGPVK